MSITMTTETMKTAELKTKVAAMSVQDAVDRAVNIVLSGEFENNREEFVKLLFGPEATESAN